MKLRPLPISIILFALLAGCNADQKVDTPATNTQAEVLHQAPHNITSGNMAPVNIVATYGHESVTLNEVDEHIRLVLFDLEWRKYQLRKETLAKLLGSRAQTQATTESANILLKPPSPPRIELPNDKRPSSGAADAPISLAIFCSYQSTHCGRLYPILQSLKESYRGLINLKFYDYPQRFHRHGYTTANAVHCAHEQHAMEAFQAALFMDQTSLENERLLLIAEQLSLEMKQFSECAESGRYASSIDADLAFGKSLGLGNVPVVFINGLYAKGPQTAEAYRYYIDQELTRLGVAIPMLMVQESTDQQVSESDLPYELIATTVSSDPRYSIAQIALDKGQAAISFITGDYLEDGIKLIQIEERRVIIEHDQKLAFIRLKTSQDYQLDGLVEEMISINEASIYEETVPGAPGRGEDARPYRELPPTGEMTLNRDWLQNQLSHQGQLVEKFHLADHVVQGVHLIKLFDIQDDRFYTTLGLRNGDVLMRVNDQWVHEQQNPLWDALENSEQITVHLMRKGLPVRYDYRVQ